MDLFDRVPISSAAALRMYACFRRAFEDAAHLFISEPRGYEIATHADKGVFVRVV